MGELVEAAVVVVEAAVAEQFWDPAEEEVGMMVAAGGFYEPAVVHETGVGVCLGYSNTEAVELHGQTFAVVILAMGEVLLVQGVSQGNQQVRTMFRL